MPSVDDGAEDDCVGDVLAPLVVLPGAVVVAAAEVLGGSGSELVVAGEVLEGSDDIAGAPEVIVGPVVGFGVVGVVWFESLATTG